MRSLTFLTIILITIGTLTGCGGNDATAKTTGQIAGTAKLSFILPDGQNKIRCSINVASDKLSVNKKGKSGADKYRLNGTIKVTSRNADSAELRVKMMLYKNGQPDGSFDFPVKVTPGITKHLNLSMGMMLSVRM
ncbi:MAG: hypothetical protein JKX85_07960 [Phycisphaeraceae bacterium]|nr:hypothetical protein [Phycisphaeraceae bacterium]